MEATAFSHYIKQNLYLIIIPVKKISKNLTFCPRRKKYNKQTLNDDLLHFYKNINFKAQFESSIQNKDQLKLKSNINWTPDKLRSCIDTFIISVDHDIKDSLVKPIPKDNLLKSEREALKNLQQRNDIIIIKADKRGAVVKIHVEDCTKEASR